MAVTLKQRLGATALGLLLVLGSGSLAAAQASIDPAAIAAADALAQERRLDEATQAYRKMLDGAANGPDAPRLADRLAQIANGAGKMEEVYTTLKPVVGGANWKSQKSPLKDRTLEMLADAASQTGRQDEALVLARQLVELRRETFGPESVEAQVSLLTVAALLDLPETEAEAKRIRDAALDTIQTVAPEQQYLDIVNNVATIAQNKRRFESAAALYDRLIAGYRKRPESVELGIVELNTAIFYRDWAAYDDAIRHHTVAIAVLERQAGPTSPDTIAAVSGLGRTYTYAGRLGAALPLLRDAYGRADQAFGASKETMDRAANLTEVLRGLGSFAEAEVIDRRVVDWAAANLGANEHMTLEARRALGLDLIGLDRAAEGKAQYDIIIAALEAERGKDDPETVAFRKRAQHIAMLSGAAPADSAEVEKLGDDLEATGHNVLLANLMSGIAEKRGDHAEELRLSRLAARLSETVFGALEHRTITMLSNVARVERRQDLPDAMATYTELERRLRLWAQREYASSSDDSVLEEVARSTREELGDMLSYSYGKSHDDPAALLLFTRILTDWKAVDSTQRAALDAASERFGEEDKALLARVRRLQQQTLTLPREAAVEVERELAIAQARLAERVAGVGDEDADSYQQVIDRLQPGEVIVDYVIAPVRQENGVVADNVYAMVAQAGGHVGLFNLGLLDEVAKPLLAAAGGPDRNGRRALYDKLIAPLERGLAGANRIHIIPDGILNLAPFDGLIDGNGRNLIETRDVRIARNARAISAGRERVVEGGGVLLVGDVDYGAGSSFAPLPYTKTEVDRIAEQIGAAKFTPKRIEGAVADEAAVQAAAQGNRILHFATHGFFQPVSETETAPLWRAGVALAGANRAAGSANPGDDGILHAAELTGWPLAGVELAVFSACDTAQGDRSYVEGLSGLPSALAAAGVKRSLLARWPVNDEGAANFMVRFYENLAVKRGYAVALRQTKLDAIAGTIDKVDENTWLAFALIENERSEPAGAEEAAADEVVAPVAGGDAAESDGCVADARSAEALCPDEPAK